MPKVNKIPVTEYELRQPKSEVVSGVPLRGLLCNPSGLTNKAPMAKELIRCIRRIQQVYSLTSKRLHILVDRTTCPAVDVQAIEFLGERFGCNVKIGQNFPAEML